MNPKETEEPAWVKKKQQKGGFDHKKTVYDGQKYGSYYRGLSFEAEGTVGQNLNLLCHWAAWVSRDQSDWMRMLDGDWPRPAGTRGRLVDIKAGKVLIILGPKHDEIHGEFIS